MNLTMQHTCVRCDQPHPEGVPKQRRYCEACFPIRRRGQVRQLTPEQKADQKAYLAAYHQERKADPAYKAKRKAEFDRYHKRRPMMRMLHNARQRAREFAVPFDLKPEDVPIPPFCPVLGIPLIRGEGARTDNSPSLDRMRPALGYVRGNVFVISERANRIKNNGTAEEHRLIAAWMEQAK